MFIHDPIGDMLSRLRNAVMRGHKEVRLPHSRIKESVAYLLEKEGYLESVSLTDGAKSEAQKDLVLGIKYFGNRPALRGLKRISRPGVRIYVKNNDIPRVKDGLGISVLSTSGGVLTGKSAREQKLGGELLCTVW